MSRGELSHWHRQSCSHIDGDQQRSLSTYESNVLLEEDVPNEITSKRWKRCMECPAVLQNLVKTYESVGIGNVGQSGCNMMRMLNK